MTLKRRIPIDDKYRWESVPTKPSKTDPSLYESTTQLISRVLRGEAINSRPIHFDGDLQKDPLKTIESRFDPSTSPNFDLSDGVEMLATLKMRQEGAKEAKKASASDNIADSEEKAKKAQPDAK